MDIDKQLHWHVVVKKTFIGFVWFSKDIEWKFKQKENKIAK